MADKLRKKNDENGSVNILPDNIVKSIKKV